MKGRAYSVLFMFAITFVCTAAVGAVKALNDERIATNEKSKLRRVILEVLRLPVAANASREDLVELFETRVRERPLRDRTLYIAHDEDGRAVSGYAFPVRGPGFWGPISAMIGLDATAARITAVRFYRHQETPGLGARITEKWFQDQFSGLTLDQGSAQTPFFDLTPPGAGKKPLGELDAVTGATQTSRAVKLFVNRELEKILQEIRQTERIDN